VSTIDGGHLGGIEIAQGSTGRKVDVCCNEREIREAASERQVRKRTGFACDNEVGSA
jgi:hypothetical protein